MGIIRRNAFFLTLAALGLYLVCVAFGFYLLASSQTGVGVLGPWQTIDQRYIYVFFAATFLLGAIILFSALPTRWVLLLLILHSFLLHSYLPLTHALLYGADQWRHIAVEQRIVEHLPVVAPTLADGSTGGAFNNLVGQVSYSALWYVSAALALIKRSGSYIANLIVVNRWLVPIFWSIAFPMLFYALVRRLGWFKERFNLFMVWLSALPFTWQANGSLTLPVSFGFLFFLGAMFLLAKRFSAGQPSADGHPVSSKLNLAWLILAAVILLCNYLLYAVLFVVLWAVGELLARLGATDSGDGAKVSSAKKILLVVIFLAVAAAVPATDSLGHYTGLPARLSLGQSFTHVVSTFLALPLARGPAPNATAVGNIIFNQTPASAFVPNIFTLWRWWIPAFLLIFWAGAIYGGWLVYRRSRPDDPVGMSAGRSQLIGKWWVIAGGGLLIGYIIERYLLIGEQVLARRLDSAIALFVIVLFGVAVEWRISQPVRFDLGLGNFGRNIHRIAHKILLLLICSIAMVASYSLGPDVRAVSVNEYRAMQEVWSSEKNSAHTCVIAGAYPLLALEAISARQIVGGGFPITNNFSQPGLERVWNIMKSGGFVPRAVLQSAFDLTGADYCWNLDNNGNLARLK